MNERIIEMFKNNNAKKNKRDSHISTTANRTK